MTRLAQLTLALWLAGGLTAFGAWTVRIYVTTELGPQADRTTRLVYRCGQGLIWAAALLIAGSLAGVVAFAVARALGGA